jgi:hypothetical protein
MRGLVVVTVNGSLKGTLIFATNSESKVIKVVGILEVVFSTLVVINTYVFMSNFKFIIL